MSIFILSIFYLLLFFTIGTRPSSPTASLNSEPPYAYSNLKGGSGVRGGSSGGKNGTTAVGNGKQLQGGPFPRGQLSLYYNQTQAQTHTSTRLEQPDDRSVRFRGQRCNLAAWTTHIPLLMIEPWRLWSAIKVPLLKRLWWLTNMQGMCGSILYRCNIDLTIVIDQASGCSNRMLVWNHEPSFVQFHKKFGSAAIHGCVFFALRPFSPSRFGRAFHPDSPPQLQAVPGRCPSLSATAQRVQQEQPDNQCGESSIPERCEF